MVDIEKLRSEPVPVKLGTGPKPGGGGTSPASTISHGICCIGFLSALILLLF